MRSARFGRNRLVMSSGKAGDATPEGDRAIFRIVACLLLIEGLFLLASLLWF